MSNNPAMEIASAIQSASLNRAPSPHHDLNPSTAASFKQPVEIRSQSPTPSLDSDIVDQHNVIEPRPRRAAFPPLPDMRFEQAYLASLQHADTYWKVAYITTRDQVLLPLVQGTLWTLALSGWRFWNRTAAVGGKTLGGRIRAWWWGVNEWKVHESVTPEPKFAANVQEVSPLQRTWGRG